MVVGAPGCMPEPGARLFRRPNAWVKCSGNLLPPPPPADDGPLWPPCHALVPRHDRNGLARNHRKQQKESQLRDIERIRNKGAELRRKATGKMRELLHTSLVVQEYFVGDGWPSQTTCAL